MLKTAKPILESQLKTILYNAAYEAMISQMEAGEADPMMKEKYDMNFRTAAMKFAQAFSETACKPMAQAIYNFVMQMGITMTPQGTLMSPHGPVTGAATINDFKVL